MENKLCIKCNYIKDIEFFNKTTRNKTGYKNICKECISNYDKEYRLKNIDKIRKKTHEYYINNIEYHNNRSNNYRKNNSKILNDKIKIRKKEDILFKLKCSLRCRTTNAFKSKKWIKTNSIKDILGQDYNFIKEYIKNLFKKGMSWDNHGLWHIDHIIPLASATTEEELIKLCHYTNLQPLWAKDNLIKKDNFIKINK